MFGMCLGSVNAVVWLLFRVVKGYFMGVSHTVGYVKAAKEVNFISRSKPTKITFHSVLFVGYHSFSIIMVFSQNPVDL